MMQSVTVRGYPAATAESRSRNGRVASRNRARSRSAGDALASMGAGCIARPHATMTNSVAANAMTASKNGLRKRYLDPESGEPRGVTLARAEATVNDGGTNRSSFGAHRTHRIGAGRAARRNERGHDSDERDQERDRAKDEGIERLDAVQHAIQAERDGDGHDQTDCRSNPDAPPTLPQHHPHEPCACCAECGAHTDLAAATRDGV